MSNEQLWEYAKLRGVTLTEIVSAISDSKVFDVTRLKEELTFEEAETVRKIINKLSL